MFTTLMPEKQQQPHEEQQQRQESRSPQQKMVNINFTWAVVPAVRYEGQVLSFWQLCKLLYGCLILQLF